MKKHLVCLIFAISVIMFFTAIHPNIVAADWQRSHPTLTEITAPTPVAGKFSQSKITANLPKQGKVGDDITTFIETKVKGNKERL